jgi:4-hydroxy-2-oxoheptanedioate aldolase
MDRGIASWMCRAFSAIHIAPIVRIPCPDPYLACQTLDGGAAGIITPYVETEEQVRSVAGALKYRPLKGKRLQEVLRGEYRMNEETRSFLNQENWNGNKLFLINIESVPAIENLDALLSVPGLDGVMVGPQDLTISLGIPEQYLAREYDEAVAEIARKTREKGLYCGVHLTADAEQAIHFIRDYGIQIMLQSNDMQAFGNYITKELDTIKKGIE